MAKISKKKVTRRGSKTAEGTPTSRSARKPRVRRKGPRRDPARQAPGAAWGFVNAFLKECKELDRDAVDKGVVVHSGDGGVRFINSRLGRKPSINDYRSFLLAEAERLFGEEKHPKTDMFLMASAVAMELQHRGFKAHKCLDLLSSKFDSRRAMFRQMNWEAVPADLRGNLTLAAAAAPYGGYTMAKKAKATDTEKTSKRASGKTWGLGAGPTLTRMFETNEKVKKSKRMTDDEMSAFLHAEFPDSTATYFDDIQPLRRKFNRGGMPGQTEVPDTQSSRYDDDGKVVVVKRGGKRAKADAEEAPAKQSKGKARIKKSK